MLTLRTLSFGRTTTYVGSEKLCRTVAHSSSHWSATQVRPGPGYSVGSLDGGYGYMANAGATESVVQSSQIDAHSRKRFAVHGVYSFYPPLTRKSHIPNASCEANIPFLAQTTLLLYHVLPKSEWTIHCHIYTRKRRPN